jgi:hypothetical protein
MTLVCLICKSLAQELDRTGAQLASIAQRHATHSGFKVVVDTIFAGLRTTPGSNGNYAKESTATNEAGGMAYCQEWEL